MLHDLLGMCERHAGLWAVIRSHLSKPDRDALAASCSRARRQSNLAVTSIGLWAHRDMFLDKDPQQAFPHAGELELGLQQWDDGEVLHNDDAVAVLSSWTAACPALLEQVTHVSVSCSDTHLLGSPSFREALVLLLSRCTKLENLVVSATGARVPGQATSELHLHFSGGPPAALPAFCLDSWIEGFDTAPTPSSALPHTTPTAARMAPQLAAFAAHHDLANLASWPHYPCLVEVRAHPGVPEPSLLVSSIQCQALRALMLRQLPPVPISADALQALPRMSHLTRLDLAGHATDGTPLTPLLQAIGGLPSLVDLSIVQGVPPEAIAAEPFDVPTSWSRLRHMTSLHVSLHQQVQLQQLSLLPAIRRLTVHEAAGHLSHLSGLQRLTALELGAESNEQLTWAEAESGAVNWGGQLQELDAEGCLGMDAAALAAVGRLTNLRVLRLHVRADVEAVGMQPLGALNMLEELCISKPAVEPELWRLLAKLPLLKMLQLHAAVVLDHPGVNHGPTVPTHVDQCVTLPSLQHLCTSSPNTLAQALVWCRVPNIESAAASDPHQEPAADFGSPTTASFVWLQPALVADYTWYQALLQGVHQDSTSTDASECVKPLFVLRDDADALALQQAPAMTLVQLGFRLVLAGDGSLHPPALEALVQHVAADAEAVKQMQVLSVSFAGLQEAMAAPLAFNGLAFRTLIRAFWKSVVVLELGGCQGLDSTWMLQNALAGLRLKHVNLVDVDSVTDDMLHGLMSYRRHAEQVLRERAPGVEWSCALEELVIAGRAHSGGPGVTVAGLQAVAASGMVGLLRVVDVGIADVQQAAEAVKDVLQQGCTVVLLQTPPNPPDGSPHGATIQWPLDAPAASVMLLGAGQDFDEEVEG